MHKKSIIVIAVIAILAVLGIILFMKFNNKPLVQGTSTIEEVNTGNFPAYLTDTNLVDSMPSSGSLWIAVGDKDYEMSKEGVKEGKPLAPEAKIWFPESYLSTLGSAGLCATIGEADRNGDLGIEIYISEIQFAWKYSSFFSLKDCLS